MWTFFELDLGVLHEPLQGSSSFVHCKRLQMTRKQKVIN